MEMIQEMWAMLAICAMLAMLMAAAFAFAFVLPTLPPTRIQAQLMELPSGLHPASIQVQSGLIRPNPT